MVMSAEELRAAGDWIVQLRKIMQLGPSKGISTDAIDSEHRSTRAGVKLLLSNLKKGQDTQHDLDTSELDIQRAVFNAVERLLKDKVNKTETGKTWVEAVNKFETVLQQEFNAKELDPNWKTMIDDAVGALRYEARIKAYRDGELSVDERRTFHRDAFTTQEGMKSLVVNATYAGDVIEAVSSDDPDLWNDPTLLADKQLVGTLHTVFSSGQTSPEVRAIIADRMLNSAEGKQVLADHPAFGAAILSDLEKRKPGTLKTLDFDQMFGKDKKGAVVGETLLTVVIANKFAKDQFSGELFDSLHKQVDPDTWNDKGEHKRGLGPRVCQALWAANAFDEICTLVEHGVDTSLAARVDGEKGPGIYSGFVQPIQHVTSKMLREIDRLDTTNASNREDCKSLQSLVTQRINELSDTHAEAAAGWTKELEAANEKAVKGDYAAAIPALYALAQTLKQASDGGETTETERQEEFERTLTTLPKSAKSFHSLLGTPTQIAGAKKLYQTLDKKGGAVTVTTWQEVQDSEMIAAFKKHPGTIWGFEHVRMPYVQAAHDTDKGNQPLRMMELWSAVAKAFPPDEYEKLLADPKAFAKTIAKEMAEAADDKDISDLQTFRENFEKDAESFLIEFASQMPKGALTATFEDVTRNTPTRPGDSGTTVDVRVSDVMGIDQSKYSASFACKAGLWWAKKQGKPLYYCLDGINMDDVIDYKRVKNQAIEDFIDGGGMPENAKRHSDVVTMQEIREILKNWDELGGTVKVVLKGKMLAAIEVEIKVKEWQQKMTEANRHAGRPKAPPKATFAVALNNLDKKLLGRIPDTDEGDKDARDLVKKSGYLTRVANTRPQILLKYLISRCAVLVQYGLLSGGLDKAAAAYAQAADNEADARKKTLLKEIKRCHASFQQPLRTALSRLRS